MFIFEVCNYLDTLQFFAITPADGEHQGWRNSPTPGTLHARAAVVACIWCYQLPGFLAAGIAGDVAALAFEQVPRN